jgi:hypothetical protein
MSGWAIRLPMRSESDTITDLGFNARALDSQEDRAIVREIAITAAMAGFKHVQQIQWALEEMTPPNESGRLTGCVSDADCRQPAMLMPSVAAASGSRFPWRWDPPTT